MIDRTTHVTNTSGERAGDRQTVDLIVLGRLIWNKLPLLALMGFLLTIAMTIVGVLALTLVLAAPHAAAVLAGPIWLAGTSVSLRLLAGDDPGMRAYLSELRQRAPEGAALALPPAVVTTLLLGTVALANAGSARAWLLAPVAADAIVLILLAFGALAVFPLAVATGLRGRERWFAGIALAGRFPVFSIGLLAAALLLALSIRFAGPVLALAAAGPYCLLVTATLRQMMHTSGLACIQSIGAPHDH
jgi:hypothetical protein